VLWSYGVLWAWRRGYGEARARRQSGPTDGRQRSGTLSAGDAHTHPVTQPDRQLAKGLSRHLDLLKRFAVHQVHQSTISVEQGVVLRLWSRASARH